MELWMKRVSKNYSEITANSTTFLYPSKSPVNRELRHGRQLPMYH